MSTDLFSLPAWIERDAWQGYADMRKRKKEQLTERTSRMALGILYKLRDQGHDANAVLAQSEFHGWIGLFPVRDAQPNRQTDRQSRAASEVDAWTGGLANDRAFDVSRVVPLSVARGRR